VGPISEATNQIFVDQQYYKHISFVELWEGAECEHPLSITPLPKIGR
jgi:isopentenyldiphosphate isomerase